MDAGDFVHHRTGGPAMLIEKINDGAEAHCSWWDERTDSFKHEVFQLCALELANIPSLPEHTITLTQHGLQ